MIFRLKTSKRTQEIFQELENRTNYKPYTLVKHAIAWSLKENTSVENYSSDAEGLDLNPDEEYFPKYVKAHIDRGSALLLDMYNHAGSVDKYILHVLGVGDTV